LHDQQKIHQFVGDLIKNKQLAAIEQKVNQEALLLTQSTNIPINITVAE
jgi:hypothetical protein